MFILRLMLSQKLWKNTFYDKITDEYTMITVYTFMFYLYTLDVVLHLQI